MFDSAIYKNRRQALRNKVQTTRIIHINFVKTVLSSISSVILIRDMQE